MKLIVHPPAERLVVVPSRNVTALPIVVLWYGAAGALYVLLPERAPS
jgi:hypothetical protein